MPAAVSRDDDGRASGVLRRSGGLLVPSDGPPPTRAEVRRTRLWLLLFLLTPVCLAVVVAFAFGIAGPPEPVVHPVSVPSGYRAISDAYYGYAVPTSYRQNPAWTDANGDYFYGTPAHGWVAETLLVRHHPPTARTAPPTTFRFDGEVRSTPFRLSGGHPIRVARTSFAWAVEVTRPGGWHALAVDTWLQDSSTQMWLLVKAPPAVTRAVVASLRGS